MSKKTRFVVGIDAGHGGTEHSPDCNSGGTCSACGTKAGLPYGLETEGVYTCKIAGELMDSIPEFIRTIYLGHPTDTLPITERADIAKRTNCDLVLSLHVNESPRTGTHGAHMLFLDGSNLLRTVAVHIAKRWPCELSRPVFGGVTKSGVYIAGMVERATKDLWPRAHYLLSCYESIPTLLVEMFYASNRSDVDRARSHGIQVQMVAAMLSGIGAAHYTTYGCRDLPVV